MKAMLDDAEKFIVPRVYPVIETSKASIKNNATFVTITGNKIQNVVLNLTRSTISLSAHVDKAHVMPHAL